MLKVCEKMVTAILKVGGQVKTAAFFSTKIVFYFTSSVSLYAWNDTSYARTDKVTWTSLAFPAKGEFKTTLLFGQLS